MLVYIPAFLLVFLQVFFAERFKNTYDETKKKGYLWAFLGLVFGIFVILFCVAGFRYGVGIDYFLGDDTNINAAKDVYKQTGVFDILYQEPIVRGLTALIVKKDLPNVLFFIFFAFFTNLCFVTAIFINKENKFILPTFILTFYMIYFTSLNQTRQSLGLAIGLLAFALIYRWKNIWVSLGALALCVIPPFIHFSTITNFVPILVYLAFRKWNDKISLRKVLITISVLIIISPILFFLLKYTLKYIPYFKKYTYFFDPTFDQSAPKAVQVLSSFVMFIIPMVNFVFTLKYLKEDDSAEKKTIVAIEGINIALMIFCVLLGSIIFADRIKTFFYMLELIFIPYIYHRLPKGKTQYIYIGLASTIMIIWTFATLPTCLVYPYRSILWPDTIIY